MVKVVLDGEEIKDIDKIELPEEVVEAIKALINS